MTDGRDGSTTTTISTNLNDRLRLWTDASYKLSGWAGDFALVMDIQDLGRAEVHLLRIEERLPAIIKRQRALTDEAPFVADDMLPNEVMALSRLWLFGLYESMRTYKSAVNGNARAWTPFIALNRVLNVVRAPLAKHAVAGRAMEHTPGLLVQPDTGRVGWNVFDPQTNTYRQVFRIALADELLSATSALLGAGQAEAEERNLQRPKSSTTIV